MTNKVDANVTSGNIVSDISDHFSQFCVSHTFFKKPKSRKEKRRDFSGFLVNKFNSELSDALLSYLKLILMIGSMSTMLFLISINTLSELAEKHAPFKTLLKRKLKQFSKPCNYVQYKLYRNKISTLTRLSKNNYYHAFFVDNLKNMHNISNNNLFFRW